MPMLTGRNTDYSLIYVMLAMIVTCCMLVVGPRLRPVFSKIVADIHLNEFEAAFEEIDHPAGTERITIQSVSGEFTGGEPGCDYFVGEVRRAGDGEQDILSVYAGQAVSGHPLQALFLVEGHIPARLIYSLPEPLKDLAGWELPSGSEREPLYLVYLLLVDHEGDSLPDCR